VLLARADSPQLRVDAKNPLELPLLEAIRGTAVQIIVEGTDGQAERMALGLVSALTSSSSFELLFDRYTRRYTHVGSERRPTW
jgi:phosphotransferase system HPr-like phosphotransfer protein